MTDASTYPSYKIQKLEERIKELEWARTNRCESDNLPCLAPECRCASRLRENN